MLTAPTPVVPTKNISRHCQKPRWRLGRGKAGVENHWLRVFTPLAGAWGGPSQQLPSRTKCPGILRLWAACTLLGGSEGPMAGLCLLPGGPLPQGPLIYSSLPLRQLLPIPLPFHLCYLWSSQGPGKKAKDRPLGFSYDFVSISKW